jgi:geranyl-CoA carboxylase alpha subunit
MLEHHMTHATPFHKILIANRGEIALRVMRSAHALGYRTVAVYSTADAHAAHVHAAHQAVCIGEPLPAQSYLNIAAIIEAARLTGADAVHPGYGFLAENEDFAQACRDAGLVFIGPSPEAIRAMGDKAGAKRLMIAAGVPCIPGYQGEDQSAEHLAAQAAQIGYPVMIKATAGGGGRGMRLVRQAADFADLLRSAQSEALNAFGDATVILERAIEAPRHIEIQILADRHGHAIHLGERDCSVQRRHQKVIEEAPSPAVDADLRARMGATAVAAVQAIAYEGAGTLEFLLDSEGHFYFMEMNTRLQVEHPVTEAITGLDLVAWQLRVAAGEPVTLTQDDIAFAGHAIEVRLCAEDVPAGFMPQSGSLLQWRPPAGVRVEHALQDGASIPPYYDSMIAKIIAQGRNRAEALRLLQSALHDLVALGVKTNQSFLRRSLAHPVFAAGQATTAFIAQHEAELLSEPSSSQALAVAAWLLHQSGAVQPPPEAARLAHALPVGLSLKVGDASLRAQVTQTGPRAFTVQVDGQTHALVAEATHAAHSAHKELGANNQHSAQSEPFAKVIVDKVMHSVPWVRDADCLWLHFAGHPLQVIDLTRAVGTKPGEHGGDGKVRASMNGRVVAVQVAVGDRVQAQQALVTLEAMKMEHVHAAPVAGTVTAVHAATGEQVPASRVLVEIQADEVSAPAGRKQDE